MWIWDCLAISLTLPMNDLGHVIMASEHTVPTLPYGQEWPWDQVHVERWKQNCEHKISRKAAKDKEGGHSVLASSYFLQLRCDGWSASSCFGS